VLGIDPSLRGTGLAVLEFIPNAPPRLHFSRTVKLKPKLSQPQCLAEIFRSVSAVFDRCEIDHVAVEQSIYVQNLKTAMNLGAARGAAVAAVAVKEMPVFEYPPLRVKQAVVGFGRASKEQVARTVKALLGHQDVLKFDEADAAGVALCHAFTYRGG
jgi:crossover junction endodeoxyribonuclease RuvC